MIVGAFPPVDANIFGGVVTSCHLLVKSSLPEKAQLVLFDSTQFSNPPPGFFVRAFRAFLRVFAFLKAFESVPLDAVVLFASPGASTLEKGVLAWYARLRGVPSLLFPRGGEAIDAAERSRLTRMWMRNACRGATMILCQGPAWQKFATGVLGFSLTLAPIIPNWTATPQLLSPAASLFEDYHLNGAKP